MLKYVMVAPLGIFGILMNMLVVPYLCRYIVFLAKSENQRMDLGRFDYFMNRLIFEINSFENHDALECEDWGIF